MRLRAAKLNHSPSTCWVLNAHESSRVSEARHGAKTPGDGLGAGEGSVVVWATLVRAVIHFHETLRRFRFAIVAHIALSNRGHPSTWTLYIMKPKLNDTTFFV